jgi:hypothetical protein
MSLNSIAGAIGAVNRPAQPIKSSAKPDSAALERTKGGDTAEVSGRTTLEPAGAEIGLAEARATLASLKQDLHASPRTALAAQANVRPHVGIVLAS